jgi:hypothetical protein
VVEQGRVEGVQFPLVDGRRRTSPTGRAVVADAARVVDPDLATRIEVSTAWHETYPDHVRALVAAELRGETADAAVARAGLTSLRQRFAFHRDGAESSLDDAVSLPPRTELDTVEVAGARPAVTELAIPYRGQQLTGDTLLRQLDAWVADDTVEPSFADAIGEVVRHPDWLDLTDRTVVVLGAGSEMGPLGHLAAWGARLALVDLPRRDLWERTLAAVRDGAGRALVPTRAPGGDDATLAASAGADLLTELPEIGAWLRQLDGPLTLGTYVYADGADNVRVSLAADALATHLLGRGGNLSLAGLLTPTDVYAAPVEVVEASRRRLERVGPSRRWLRQLSRGRVFAPNYEDTIETPAGASYGLADAIVPQQGPNYALAKRLAQWRLLVARADGIPVSANVAPATRTRSVTSNRVLAAAYAGAPRFEVEVFEPATSRALMAALLVRDLRDPSAPGQPGARLPHPLGLLSDAAAHGGLWRNPFAPRTVLPIAAVLGLPGVLRGS